MVSLRRLPLRRTLVLVGTTAVLMTTPPAVSAPEADYEMPFRCGEQWTGTTRAHHSPSIRSVDWNRAGDFGKPVVAAATGRVTESVRNPRRSGYGRHVVLDHGNGESTLYAHLRGIALRVEVGRRIKQGVKIGSVGSSGNSTGPHLHFEEKKGRRVVHPYFGGKRFRFGTSPRSGNCPDEEEEEPEPRAEDVPLAGQWIRDRKALVTVFRRTKPAQFVIRRLNPKLDPMVVRLGLPTDEPVLGDWDGNIQDNAGVFRQSTGRFILRSPGTKVKRIKYSTPNGQPFSGDWNGDGVDEIGIRSPYTQRFRMRQPNGSTKRVKLGDRNDLPVTGDWDRDGVTDLGVYDVATATFTLRKVDAEGVPWTASIQFGNPGDLPVVGDWDNNGRDDLGVWDPETAKFSKRIASAPTNRHVRRVETETFGNARR